MKHLTFCIICSCILSLPTIIRAQVLGDGLEFDVFYPIGKSKFEIVRDRDNNYSEGIKYDKTFGNVATVINYVWIDNDHKETFKYYPVIIEYYLKYNSSETLECYKIEITGTNDYIDRRIKYDGWVRMGSNNYLDYNQKYSMIVSLIDDDTVRDLMRMMTIIRGN